MFNLDDITAHFTDLQKLDVSSGICQYKIDGVTYTSNKLPATVGLEVLAKATSVLGPGLLKVMAGGDSPASGLEMVIAVASRASQEGFVDLVRDLIRNIQANEIAGIKKEGRVLPEFDEHFSGRYLHLLKVVMFAAVHNFSKS